jgi:hypothetical protein
MVDKSNDCSVMRILEPFAASLAFCRFPYNAHFFTSLGTSAFTGITATAVLHRGHSPHSIVDVANI